jgi:hypothetical protein
MADDNESGASPTNPLESKNPPGSKPPWPGLSWIYLILSVLGALLPWLANLEFIRQHGGGFDLGLFVNLANANPAAQSLSRDLLISSSAVTIWIVVEAKRLNMRGLAVTLGLCFGVAFACGAPFFLYLRERRLKELSLNAQGH